MLWICVPVVLISIFVGQRAWVLLAQTRRLQGRIAELQRASVPDISRTQFLDEQLYTLVSQRGPFDPHRATLLLAGTSTCGPCMESLIAWRQALNQQDAPPLQVWYVELDRSDGRIPATGPVSVAKTPHRILGIQKLATYRTVTGIERIPFAIMFDRDRRTRCVVDGEANAGAVSSCLERLRRSDLPIGLIRGARVEAAWPRAGS